MCATLKASYEFDIDTGTAMPVLDHICILFLRDSPTILFGKHEHELHHAARVAMHTHGSKAARCVTLRFLDNKAEVVSNLTLANDYRWPTRLATFMVLSNHGEIEVDELGRITNVQRWDDSESIPRSFNVEEWRKHYGRQHLPDVLDILDLGFWYDDGYQEPEHEWRDFHEKERRARISGNV